jgi:hypothetical protein
VAAVSVEEDILYQWRLRRRLEEARREAKSEGTRRTQVHPNTPDPGMETGVPGMGTGQGMSNIGTGLVGRIMDPMLAPYPLAGSAVTEHEEREKLIGILTDLGVIGSSSCSEGHGGVTSPSTSSSTNPSSSSSSSPRVDKKDEVVGSDFTSHTCTAKEEQLTSADNKHQSSTNTEKLTPGPLSQGEEEKEPGGCKNQNSFPHSSEGPEDGSSSSNVEGEPKTAPTNQRMISESTLTSVTQLNQPTTVLQPHTPSLHGDGYHGNDGLDLEGSVGVEESSYWTISPCGSPDSARAPYHPGSLGPLINEV